MFRFFVGLLFLVAIALALLACFAGPVRADATCYARATILERLRSAGKIPVAGGAANSGGRAVLMRDRDPAGEWVFVWLPADGDWACPMLVGRGWRNVKPTPPATRGRQT